MRICSPQLGLSPEATLGGEVYDREILTRLAGLGAEVEVLLPKGLPAPEIPNLRVAGLPLRLGLRWFVANPLYLPYIGRLYRQRPFDLLRVHSLRFTGPAALAARRLYRLPVPVIAHHHHLDRDRWTDHLERRVAQQCDLIITGSEFARRQTIAELDVPPERMAVVYYGVDDKYAPGQRDEALARQLGIAGQPTLLYLGSLKQRKNLPVLLQTLHLVLQERDDVRLLLVGRGESEETLRQQSLELGLAQAVCFAGHVPEAEKVAWYNLANLFVQPSRLEGFGLSAAEAMACGKPVVASRAGSLPEVVAEGETGLLCNPDKPADFAQAILRLVADRPMADAMGQAGLARVQRLFQWDESARRTLALYAEAQQAWQTGE